MLKENFEGGLASIGPKQSSYYPWTKNRTPAAPALNLNEVIKLEHLLSKMFAINPELPDTTLWLLSALSARSGTVEDHDQTYLSRQSYPSWCITFEFENGDTYQVDFEQYH